MKMIIVTGHVPNIPWWRALNMSDAEVEEFNNKHLTVIEMKDDSLADTCDGQYKNSQEFIDKVNAEYDDLFARDNAKIVGKDVAELANGNIAVLENVYGIEVWNKAIEAAASIVDQANKDGPYQAIASAKEIRKLKK